MSYVRITNTDPARRETHSHPNTVLVCRADDLAETVLGNGWLGSNPAVGTRDTLYALQRAVCVGADTSGMERSLSITVESAAGSIQAHAAEAATR